MWTPVTYSTRMSVKKEISRQMFRLRTNLDYSSKYGMNYTTKYKKVGSNYTTMTVNSVTVAWTFSICFNNSSLLAKEVLHSLQGCFPGHLLLSEWVLIDPMTISPQTWQNFSNCPLTQISVSWWWKWGESQENEVSCTKMEWKSVHKQCFDLFGVISYLVVKSNTSKNVAPNQQ